MGITYLGEGMSNRISSQRYAALPCPGTQRDPTCSGVLRDTSVLDTGGIYCVLNLCPSLRYAKTYDAVVKVSLGHEIACEFAIEYERTLKSERRYESVVEAIANEKRLQVILYLTSSYEVASTLRSLLQHVQARILLAHVDKFKRDLLDTQVDDIGRYQRIPLRAALADFART